MSPTFMIQSTAAICPLKHTEMWSRCCARFKIAAFVLTQLNEAVDGREKRDIAGGPLTKDHTSVDL